ncbi:MAG: vWA domain-containing protein [Candidatus Binataceae bacterium]
MKPNKQSIVRRLRDRQRGQSIVMITMALVSLLGATGLAVDIGRVYYASEELQASTQAAALAGGAALSSSTASEAIAAATQYGAGSGGLNANSNLTNVSMATGYPLVKCLTTTGILCSASPANENAIVVKQQATVPTTFAKVFGVNSWTISATATASAKGGYNGPYNVEIILDTTASMGDTDSESTCNSTRLSCALAGIRVLLGTLSPCAAGLASCGTATTETPTVGANVPNPVDEAGLMVFPGLTSTTQVPDDYVCPTKSPSITTYNNAPVYQIIALSSNYRTSDTATSLNTSSDFVIAAGGGSCSGVTAPGGEGTFYAGVIDAAQAQLVASARPNTKNVMILISDGNASSSSSQMAGTKTSYKSTNECHQAITSAQNAAAAGTTVYSVAYGAESSGCSTDSPAITPCQTMQQIASSSQNFFSDYTATGGTSACVSASRPTSSMNQIFTEIGEDLTVARLIPNNTQ